MELRADLGPARDRFFNAQVGLPDLRDRRWPPGFAFAGDRERRTVFDFVSRRGARSLCKSPVFRLYYQENTGVHACKSAPSALFFVRRSPVSVSLYRGGACNWQSAACAACELPRLTESSSPAWGRGPGAAPRCRPGCCAWPARRGTAGRRSRSAGRNPSADSPTTTPAGSLH